MDTERESKELDLAIKMVGKTPRLIDQSDGKIIENVAVQNGQIAEVNVNQGYTVITASFVMRSIDIEGNWDIAPAD